MPPEHRVIVLSGRYSARQNTDEFCRSEMKRFLFCNPPMAYTQDLWIGLNPEGSSQGGLEKGGAVSITQPSRTAEGPRPI